MKFLDRFKKRKVTPYSQIKAEIYKQGYTNIKDFASDIDMNYSTLINKLLGRRRWYGDEQHKIAQALNKDIESLFYKEV